MTRRVPLLLIAAALSAAGCSAGVERPYGRARGASINGTGTLVRMFRDRGHDVRVALRLTDGLADWADVIVRVSPFAGPPRRDESDWYDAWLGGAPGRRIVYVTRDHDADVEYWERALEQLPPDATPRLRERVGEALDRARRDDARFPQPSGEAEASDPESWFALEPPGTAGAPAPAPGPPAGVAGPAPPQQVCGDLEGPWASGLRPAGLALPFRRWLRADDGEAVLLACGTRPLAMSWSRPNGARLLVVANASFLLNASLAAHPARGELAARLVDWAGYAGDESEGESGSERPKRVAFVEGAAVASEPARQPSVFDLLRVDPFGKVAAQLLALGLAACLARAPRLGRPRAAPPSGAERPAAHPEALGALLARTRQAGVARALLEEYRAWRHAPAAGAPGRRPGPPRTPGR